MAVKVCRSCKEIITEGNKCPSCGSENIADSFKGRVVILDPEKSEIAKNLKHSKKGAFAIKV